MLTNYNTAKENVLKCCDIFLKTVDEITHPESDSILQSIKTQTESIKKGKFSLLVAGEAKSGKSTFINAYLGVEILPMDVCQCTSAVIEIHHGEEAELRANMADGRCETIKGKEGIKDFLSKYAAIDDNYRQIPVAVIDNELLVKSKGKHILKEEIDDLIIGVKKENLYELPIEEYDRKIREYISQKQPKWGNIVTKIEIRYPYADKNMREISIIDSPGVNAMGRVGNITEGYIKSADAIMFLRPITGVAIEANSFKEFLEAQRLENKNAMFLLLTRAAIETEETRNRAFDEFVKIFGADQANKKHGIAREQIIAIDSKAELYYNQFKYKDTEEIKTEIRSNKSDLILKSAWLDGEENKDGFLEQLRVLSRFGMIEQALNQFGLKAKYIALSRLLADMLKANEKFIARLEDSSELYRAKRKDPKVFAEKIARKKDELTIIQNKMNKMADDILAKYSGNEAEIARQADEIVKKYVEATEKIKGKGSGCLRKLENLSVDQIDFFKEYALKIQNDVVSDCNSALQAAIESSGGNVRYISLEPNLTATDIEALEESIKNSADVNEQVWVEGDCFSSGNYRPVFSQAKFFDKVKSAILCRVNDIKAQAIRDLRSFVDHTVNIYVDDLAKNAELIKSEMTIIERDRRDAESIAKTIETIERQKNMLVSQKNALEQLKGDIDRNA